MNRQITSCRFNVQLFNGTSTTTVSGFPVTVKVTSGSYALRPYYHTGSAYDEAITGKLRSQLGGYRFEAVLSWDRLIDSQPLLNFFNNIITTTSSDVIITFYPDNSDLATAEEVIINDIVWVANMESTIMRQPLSVSLIGKNIKSTIPQFYLLGTGNPPITTTTIPPATTTTTAGGTTTTTTAGGTTTTTTAGGTTTTTTAGTTTTTTAGVPAFDLGAAQYFSKAVDPCTGSPTGNANIWADTNDLATATRISGSSGSYVWSLGNVYVKIGSTYVEVQATTGNVLNTNTCGTTTTTTAGGTTTTTTAGTTTTTTAGTTTTTTAGTTTTTTAGYFEETYLHDGTQGGTPVPFTTEQLACSGRFTANSSTVYIVDNSFVYSNSGLTTPVSNGYYPWNIYIVRIGGGAGEIISIDLIDDVC
jgi:hypothetical protein